MKNISLLLFCFVWIPLACFSQDTTKIIKPFPNKITHSFSIQYNNCIYPKAKMKYITNFSEAWWSPKVGYDRSIFCDYQMTFPSGMGMSFEYFQGWHGLALKNNKNEDVFVIHDFGFFSFPNLGYCGLGVKATNMCAISNRLFIKSEIGLRFPYFTQAYMAYGVSSNASATDTLMFLNMDNFSCQRLFVPDLSIGVSFLFHTQRNPRNNLILGLNANIGFVPRYKGYYAIQSPFTVRESVCDISTSSTYFGINVGYAFIGLPKTFFRKQYWKSMSYHTFDFNKSIHSISLFLNNTFAIGSKTINRTGPISSSFRFIESPEVALKYNYTFAKGFGISAIVPVGIFKRYFNIELSGVIPKDTLWANGAVGTGYAEGNEGLIAEIYTGLSICASYMAQIHRNLFIQPEFGIAFKPFIHSEEEFGALTQGWLAAIYAEDAYSYGIPFAEISPSIYVKSYWIPELSGAINFYVHGKNPQHNFVFGLNFNIDFSKRITIDYRTLSTFPAKYQSSGQIIYNMTTIGLHVGYQFMTGRKVPNIKG